MYRITLLIATLGAISPSLGLVGYDCGGEGLNITSLSLTHIADCYVEDTEPKANEVYLQLLQLSEFDHTEVIQCRIEIDRTIYHCGMHSHDSVIQNGKHEYIREVSAETCRKLHNTGSIFLGNNAQINGIKSNSTNTRSFTFAGQIEPNGYCTGTTFSDPYGTWYNVVVQAIVKITIRNFQVPLQFASNEIILPSGVHCRANQGECNDADGTTTYWRTLPTDNCKFNQYDVLYEGLAHKLTPPKGQENDLTIYTVTTEGATFALTKTSETNLCGYTMTHTEHPKLFVLETQRGRTFKTTSKIKGWTI